MTTIMTNATREHKPDSACLIWAIDTIANTVQAPHTRRYHLPPIELAKKTDGNIGKLTETQREQWKMTMVNP